MPRLIVVLWSNGVCLWNDWSCVCGEEPGSSGNSGRVWTADQTSLAAGLWGLERTTLRDWNRKNIYSYDPVKKVSQSQINSGYKLELVC